MKTKTTCVFFTCIAGFEIKLSQAGKDSFTIIYGAQIWTQLSYHVATRKLGECIMHASACEGKLINA